MVRYLFVYKEYNGDPYWKPGWEATKKEIKRFQKDYPEAIIKLTYKIMGD